MYIDKSIIKIIDYWFNLRALLEASSTTRLTLRMCPDVFILGLLAPLHVHGIEIPYRAFPERVGSLPEKEDRGSRIEDQRSRIEVGGWRVGDQKSGIGDRGLVEKTWKNRGSWWCGPQTVDKFHKKLTPLAVLSTKFQYTIPSLTESVIVWTRKWNFPGKLNALFQWYRDKMHAVYSSKHCTLRSRT